MTPVILIYAFGPFLRYRRNVTQAILEALPPRPEWHTVVLPVRFDPDLFLPLVESLRPDYILGLGQCPRGGQIRIERKAHNLMRHKKAEPGEPIDPQGPPQLIPNWRIAANSQRRASYDAGRYVCNYSMYLMSRYATEHNSRYAFLHIPKTYSVSKAVEQIVRLLEQSTGPESI